MKRSIPLFLVLLSNYSNVTGLVLNDIAFLTDVSPVFKFAQFSDRLSKDKMGVLTTVGYCFHLIL